MAISTPSEGASALSNSTSCSMSAVRSPDAQAVGHTLQQRCGAFASQGKRDYQEDRHKTHTDDAALTAYGVFDGHGGDAVSSLLVGELDFLTRLLAAVRATQSVAEALSQVYTETNKEILRHPRVKPTCGSCAVTALVQRAADGSYHAHVANCGDARCLMFNGATRATTRLSVDHEPRLPAERQRIEAAGGQVLRGRLVCDCAHVAMSRAMGDGAFADFGMVADPHVHSAPLAPGDAFLLLCSDGLTEQMSDSEACSIVASCLASGDTPENAAKTVVRLAIHQRKSADNVTAVVVQLVWAAV